MPGKGSIVATKFLEERGGRTREERWGFWISDLKFWGRWRPGFEEEEEEKEAALK
jgi:hypothetical protein